MFQRRLFTCCRLLLLTLLITIPAPAIAEAEISEKQQQDTYQHLETFAAILSILQEHYVEEIDTKEVIEGAIDGLLLSLDPHSSYLKPEHYREFQEETSGAFTGIGIEITLKDGVITVIAPIEDTPAARAGIKANDKIIKINGDFTKGKSPFDAVKLLRGPKGSEVTISIFREGWQELKDFTLSRDTIPLQSVRSFAIKPGLGYLRITNFQRNTTKEVREHLTELRKDEPLRGLILDLRNNPGGLLDQAVNVADLFLAEGLIVYTRGRNKELDLTYEAHRDERTESFYPLVVLVNEGSASASEIVAGAVQDHKRGVIVGSKTFGKGSVQTIVPLADGAGLRMTTARYYTPSGRSIQATGILPDIAIELANGSTNETGESSGSAVREEDLENHFFNQSDKPADETPEFSDEMRSRVENDNQLREAYNILKSLILYASFNRQQTRE
ncbi:MAG: S41 family peptidase [Desulfofustis sp.]|jgi:carboxyl-terminal processing protease|nr:S41 family peptidase [Desulfofustis sp.]